MLSWFWIRKRIHSKWLNQVIVNVIMDLIGVHPLIMKLCLWLADISIILYPIAYCDSVRGVIRKFPEKCY